jgi:hypothetical protein
VGKLLGQAAQPMKAVKNRLATAEKKPGDANKSDAENAGEKAKAAAEKLAAAAAKLREAAEAAKASAAENPGQAPASAACGAPTSGSNEIVVASAPGPGAGPGDGPGPGPGGPGPGTDRVVEKETVIRDAADSVRDRDYDRAVRHYDTLLRDEPENVTYLRDRAGAHLERGGYDYAIRDYDRLARVVKEPDADLYYNRGCEYLAAG